MSRFLRLILLVIAFQFLQSQCPPVTQLEYFNYTGNSVELNWQENGSGAVWEIEYGLQGFSQGSGIIITTLNHPFYVQGIIPNTIYDFYIRSDCGANTTSTWVGPLTVPYNGNMITGNIKWDQNGSGCSNTNPNVSGVLVKATSPIINYTYMASTDTNGNYSISLPNGNFDVSTNLNSSFINVSPSRQNISFTTSSGSAIQDFCIASSLMQEDMSVIVLPINPARPGFDSHYRVVLTNQGTSPISNVLEFNYPNDYVTLMSAIPNASNNAGSLSWNYTLNPFQSLTYEITFNLNPPTHTTFPLNSGDILNFSAFTYLTGADVDLTNNIFNLNQEVVNSYDPNDKTCLQGNRIEPDMIGEYLDYMIRFENTGTARAINVRVKDVIDTSKFDLDSFVPLSSSHEYYASITNGNEIEFHFDDINLDFNDATNDGYVLFKIKTLNTLAVGDSFDNTAEIYFDFNFPIITNTETVTISNTASVDEHSENSILLSPNPSQDFISLDASFTINSLVIYDVQGRLQSQYDESTTDFEAPISIAKLNQGVYFLVVKSDQGQETLKFIKK